MPRKTIKKKFFILSTIVALMLTQSACLKTRAQLHEDPKDEASTQGTEAPAKKGTAYEIEEMKNEITRLSGKIDELEHQNRAFRPDEMKAAIDKLDARVVEAEKNQVIMLTELKDMKDKEQAAKTHNTTEPPKGLLAEARQLSQSGDYEQAAEKFRALTERNLKGPERAEAYYGLGDCEYHLKNYKKAIVAFSKIQELSPKSKLIPSSLYLIALSFEHLNMKKEAQGFYSDLVERYPQSAEAKKAKSKSKQ